MWAHLYNKPPHVIKFKTRSHVIACGRVLKGAESFGKLQLDYFVLSETKIDESFPSAQLNIHDYEIRNRRDRDKHGGGLSGIYRPPRSNNIVTFSEELTDLLSRAINSYDNIILMGDFNIDIKKENSTACDILEKFCDTFNLTNLVKSKTCFMNNHKSTVDLILTNKRRSFQITNVTETGVSDCHELITTFMKSHISRLKPQNVYYCNCKCFNEEKFLSDVKEVDFSFKISNPDENYLVLTNVFSKIVNKHAPLKKKTFRGNDAPFMNKELRKAIYTGSRPRNRYFKNPTKENERSYKNNEISVCHSEGGLSHNIFLR